MNPMTPVPKPQRRPPAPRAPIKRGPLRRYVPKLVTLDHALDNYRDVEVACFETLAIFVKLRDDGRCLLCHSTAGIQCAHLISRRYRFCRFFPENAWTLCQACHKRWTEDPLGWEALCKEKIGEAHWEQRKQIARIPSKQALSQLVLILYGLRHLVSVELSRAYHMPSLVPIRAAAAERGIQPMALPVVDHA